MYPLLLFLLSLVLVLLRYVYRRFTRISLFDIPGPKPTSFLLGNSKELFQSFAGEQEFDWQNEFGGIARIKASFGEERLWLSDPKALQYILQTSGYNYPRPADRREFARLATDDGLVWADGDTHKRHRKVMLPAFGAPQIKAFFPIFRESASKLVTKWKELVVNNEEDMEQSSSVINVNPWIGRATLDAIGEAAFDYDFNAIEGESDPLVKSYNDFMRNAFGMATPAKIFFDNICHHIPEFLLTRLNSSLPGEAMRKVRENRTLVHKVAKTLIKDKSNALLEGKGKRDVMTLLIKANASEDPRTKLSDYEMISQMRTIMLAGHETTANSISFLLLELAKHPEVQMRIRQEIREMNFAKAACGESQLDVQDLESMPYTIAVVKECFRVHPIVYHITRVAGKDDALPLSEPIVTKSGKTISEVPVAKGTNITLSFAAYNRNKNIWGEDADQFRPERWLVSKEKHVTPVGVYANLLTFSAGTRACIGWRFAVLEVQTFLIELVSNFEFTMTKESEKVRRLPCAVMVPVIEGEETKGAQLPLKVSVAVN